MKIFITIPWFHPAYKAGGPIQSIVNLVQELDPAAYQFKIFCGNKDLDGTILTGVEPDQWIDHSANTKVWYASSGNILPLLKKEIKNEKPDILFINGIYSWSFNFKPLLFCHDVKKVISARGMLHPGALSQKRFKKKIYLLTWKLFGLPKRASFHATDNTEKKYIQQVFTKGARVVVAANFPRLFSLFPVIEKKEGQLKLLSIALISPMKNILMVLEALSAVDGHPGATQIEYNIYGPVKDEHYWQECVAVIKKMPANIVVNYHGDIAPAEIANALAFNHVFILPSKSENFGHAIIEALSAGRPVITSRQVPWSGLQEARAGMNVPVDHTTELKKAIEYFAAMNHDELISWSKEAHQYATEKIDLKKIRAQYDEVFRPASP